jgi:hypothetical protein
MGGTAGCGSQAHAVLALRYPTLQRDCPAGNKARWLVSRADNEQALSLVVQECLIPTSETDEVIGLPDSLS